MPSKTRPLREFTKDRKRAIEHLRKHLGIGTQERFLVEMVAVGMGTMIEKFSPVCEDCREVQRGNVSGMLLADLPERESQEDKEGMGSQDVSGTQEPSETKEGK